MINQFFPTVILFYPQITSTACLCATVFWNILFLQWFHFLTKMKTNHFLWCKFLLFGALGHFTWKNVLLLRDTLQKMVLKTLWSNSAFCKNCRTCFSRHQMKIIKNIYMEQQKIILPPKPRGWLEPVVRIRRYEVLIQRRFYFQVILNFNGLVAMGLIVDNIEETISKT